MASKAQGSPRPTEDPITIVPRIVSKLNTLWMRKTYGFASFGTGSTVHYSCDISRTMAVDISIGADVYIAPHVWLNIAANSTEFAPKIVLGNGCKIGRRSTISSRNQIVLEPNVLLAPSVLIMDHNHEFSNVNEPIHAQGVTEGGRIVIGENSWLGHGAVVVCSHGELVIGRNSVIGSNSVVTRSFPPFSVIAGIPAKRIKSFDPTTGQWVKVHGEI